MSTHYLLAIESSCDETAAALFHKKELLSECIATQHVHASYGGVMPEEASRAHLQHIVPVVDQVCQEAGIPLKKLTGIAFTQCPGLIGALFVGASFAKGLALTLGIPSHPIHHIKAHLFASFITPPYPTFPFLGLVVSGGHTQLLWVKSYEEMTLLGETLDDAVGEAFDKIAKLLGFSYPGGVYIDQHARKGNPNAFSFPITRLPRLNFSFSGIKTAVLYFLRDRVKKEANFIAENLSDLCASVENALVTMITEKVIIAMEESGSDQLVIGGGVAANSELQQRLHQIAIEKGWKFFCPPLHHCQDNAAMIGIAAYYRMEQSLLPLPDGIDAQPMAKMSL